jgi:proton glutamate symport protein
MHLKRRRFSQTQWVIVSVILGVAVGYFFPDSKAAGLHASDLQVLSNVFLRLIKMLIAPLIFSTLFIGIAGHGDDLRRVGRLAWRSILYWRGGKERST